jgi:transcriptional regulator with XRE-family HTH domain
MDIHRFKAARQRAGLTLVEVAERLGVSRNLPGNWERGERKPSIQKLEAVARLLNVSVSWLTGDKIIEASQRYDNKSGPATILSDYSSPPGLRDLAMNRTLHEALSITSEEWGMLRSLTPPNDFKVHGYIAVLMAIRTATDKPVTRL